MTALEKRQDIKSRSAMGSETVIQENTDLITVRSSVGEDASHKMDQQAHSMHGKSQRLRGVYSYF
jgi:hypothetical protein